MITRNTSDPIQLEGVLDMGFRGDDGITPHIGENGNWWVGDTDTGKPSRGEAFKYDDFTHEQLEALLGPGGPSRPFDLTASKYAIVYTEGDYGPRLHFVDKRCRMELWGELLSQYGGAKGVVDTLAGRTFLVLIFETEEYHVYTARFIGIYDIDDPDDGYAFMLHVDFFNLDLLIGEV